MLRILSLKDALRAGILLSLCLSLVGLSSCSDDDEDPDAVPTVSFGDLANNSTIWNTVSATLDVDDDNGIEKVEVYIDGVLFKTLTAAPYEMSWDTNTASEGTHVIKAVVTDGNGNESTAEITVTVKNILLTMDVAANQLRENELGFIILTSDSGAVIASAEYHNGDHIELKSTTYNGEKYTLTEVLVGMDEYYPVGMWTFPQVERGRWTAYDADNAFSGEVQANLSLTNAVVGGGYYRFVTNSTNLSGEAHAATYETSTYLMPPSSKLYIARYNDDPSVADTYRILQSIVEGDNPAINMGDVNQPLSSVTVDVPQGASGLDVNLRGYPVAGNYSEYYNIDYFQTESSPLQIQYPGTAFPSYFSETYYSTDDFRFSSGRTTAFYNVSAFSYTGEFNVAENRLNYSISGDYDFSTIGWIGEVEGETITRWIFVLPKGASQSVAFPDLTATLTDLMAVHFGNDFDFAPYAPDFTQAHDGYSFLSYEAIEGYDGLKTFIKGSQSGIGQLVNNPTNYTTLDIKLPDAGGRVASGRVESGKRVRRNW